MSLLEIKGIRVGYGRAEAIFGIDLKAEEGQITTVIGPNGAGKTTLLAATAGLNALIAGRIRFDGDDITRLPIEDRLAAGIALVPEKRELFADMAVEDNLGLGAYLRGRAGAVRACERIYALFPRLKERRRQLAGTLSGGERQMLALGRALMCGPRLLLLDEPSLGLAPRIIAQTMQVIRQLRDEGTSIVLVEQNARAALAIADRGYVIESGRITLEGGAQDLACDPRVAAIYIGTHGGASMAAR
ncbi:MAG TPA: ABC transporter ATP-binding protein [Xanthobacteraceae bacterium]|jgi:branched-chain amino acid transport system ATP-binding protein|nr:MAG: ABC transporter ATP-binding protein [Rhizobiales bacterium 39-66-18]HQS07465.1 ABC transporter ATP-binding protein [Xanthobacteraceae bacterium]HQS47014.1 ABC transporter ATP-binding protein [Xanthobacteraceae bacterium]